jgi:hypothetical protein
VGCPGVRDDLAADLVARRIDPEELREDADSDRRVPGR